MQSLIDFNEVETCLSRNLVGTLITYSCDDIVYLMRLETFGQLDYGNLDVGQTNCAFALYAAKVWVAIVECVVVV